MAYKFGFPFILELSSAYIERILANHLRASIPPLNPEIPLKDGTTLKGQNLVLRLSRVKLNPQGTKPGVEIRYQILHGAINGVSQPQHLVLQCPLTLQATTVSSSKPNIGNKLRLTIQTPPGAYCELQLLDKNSAGLLQTTAKCSEDFLRATAELDLELLPSGYILHAAEAALIQTPVSLAVAISVTSISIKTYKIPFLSTQQFAPANGNLFSAYKGQLKQGHDWSLFIDEEVLLNHAKLIFKSSLRERLLLLVKSTNKGDLEINQMSAHFVKRDYPSNFELEMQANLTSRIDYKPYVSQGESKKIKAEIRGKFGHGLYSNGNPFAVKVEFFFLQLDGWSIFEKISLRSDLVVVEFASGQHSPKHRRLEPLTYDGFDAIANFPCLNGKGGNVSWEYGLAKTPDRVYVKKGRKSEVTISNLNKASGRERLDLSLMGSLALPDFRLIINQQHIPSGGSAKHELEYTGSGRQEALLKTFANGSMPEIPVIGFERYGTLKTPAKLTIISYLSDTRGAGGTVGVTVAKARLTVEMGSNDPVAYRLVRDSPLFGLSINGPAQRILDTSTASRQTYLLEFNPQGLTLPQTFNEKIKFIAEGDPSVVHVVEIWAVLRRPDVYVPFDKLSFLRETALTPEIKWIIRNTERLMKLLTKPRGCPPTPGPRPPNLSDWLVVREMEVPECAEVQLLTSEEDRFQTRVQGNGYTSIVPIQEGGNVRLLDELGPEPRMVSLSIWYETELLQSPFPEPMRQVCWFGERLLSFSANRLYNQFFSTETGLVPGSISHLEAELLAGYDLGEDLLLVSEAGLHLLSGEALLSGTVIDSLPEPFHYMGDRVRAATVISPDSFVIVYDGRLEYWRQSLAASPELIAEVSGPHGVHQVITKGNRIFLFGEEGIEVRTWQESDLERTGITSRPVARCLPFGGIMLILFTDGQISTMDIIAESPLPAGELLLANGVAPNSLLAVDQPVANGRGYWASLAEEGYLLRIHQLIPGEFNEKYWLRLQEQLAAAEPFENNIK